MAAITISTFSGENRAAEPKLLPDGQGTLSLNHKPGRGDLRAWREPLQVMLAPSRTQAQTIYRMGREEASDTRFWLSWPGVVHVARGFDTEDATERTVYSGDGYPKVTDNTSASEASPTPNPRAHRPLGIPAPVRAPDVVAVVAPEGADVGKYALLLTAQKIDQLKVGDTYRLSVQDQDPQEFTLQGADKVEQAQLAAQLHALRGVRADALPSTDADAPVGIRIVSDDKGKGFTLSRLTGTSSDYGFDAATLQPLLNAAGGAGADVLLVSTTVRASNLTNSQYALLIPEKALQTLAAGDLLRVTVGGALKAQARITGNSKAAVVAAFAAAGANAQDQPYVPGSYNGEGSGYAGQDSGVLVPLGVQSVGAEVRVVRNPPLGAALVASKAWLAANAKPGDRWQVTANGAQPVLVTLTEGPNTYPAAVTAQSLKAVLTPVQGIKCAEEMDASGAPQLRIETAQSGAQATLAIAKVVPASKKNWGETVTATAIAPPKRDVQDYFYCYTYVNDWGWESAPSPVSKAIERTAKEQATLSGFEPPPSGGYNVNRIRVYRTQAGSTEGADFFYLLEVPVSASQAQDDARDIAEVLASKRWLPAPGVPRGGADNYTEPALSFLTPLWNGLLAGIVGKSVRVCEPYTPYAWPMANDVVPPDGAPLALGVFGQNLLVLTAGRPLVVSGSAPEALDQAPLEMPQGCIAPRSAVSMGAGVAWASNDGLCWYGAGGARILTAGVLTRQDWLALRPQTIIGQMYEGMYFGSYEPVPGQGRRGFLVSPEGGGVYFLDEGFDAAHFDGLTDQLYVLRGNRVLKWDAGASLLSATFKSRVYRQPRPVQFGCAEVVATSYPVRFSLWADGVQRLDMAVNSREPFRLPAGFLAMDWQVQVSTPPGAQDGGVQAVLLAQTMQELAQL